LGAPIAIKAMAAKLARLVCRMHRYGMKYVDQGAAVYELRHRELQIKRLSMLRYGMKYVDQGAEFYDTQHRQVQIKNLKWKAAKLGFQIVQAPAA
jgi:hypothetical protein